MSELLAQQNMMRMFCDRSIHHIMLVMPSDLEKAGGPLMRDSGARKEQGRVSSGKFLQQGCFAQPSTAIKNKHLLLALAQMASFQIHFLSQRSRLISSDRETLHFFKISLSKVNFPNFTRPIRTVESVTTITF